jgi:SAM-dependent methyltransferase
MEPTAGTTSDPAEALRAQLHGMWDSVAPGWGAHADYVDTRGVEATTAMLDATAPGPGDRVLELACGPGSVGLAAAARVGPSGEVVLSDVAPEMVAVAAARADATGARNVSACVLDLEQIEQPHASYDIVLCREGLMFALDPARAVGEIHRVLRPGGRTAIAVWGPPADNPWLAVVFDAVSEQLGSPIPPRGIPGPFSLSDQAQLAGLLTDAGFVDVRVDELAVPLRASSVDEWWTRTTALAGPLANLIAGLPETAATALRDRLDAAVTRYRTGTGLEFPGVTLLATAHR